MLAEIGIVAVRGAAPPEGAERLNPLATAALGIALGVFKAAQLLEIAGADPAFTNFTAIDLETTGTDRKTSEIIEIAAVRVRNGVMADTFHSLVKPRGRVPASATAVHGIDDAELASEPRFEEVWPRFRDFCGQDVVVAHNGYDFDFPILHRMASESGDEFDLCTFDTLPLARDLFPTSRKLQDLARQFGIDPGRSHRALDDTKALAQLVGRLGEIKLARTRKTALVDLLGNLGVALALSELDPANAEARLFLRDLTPVFALGKWSGALDAYEEERGDDASLPSVEDVIVRLGGRERMERIRATKSADERYPEAMTRLRRLIAEIPEGTLAQQLEEFLDRVALSTRSKEPEPEDTRVNLLTLHSTKGLEFSRVYVVGAEDAQLPGGSPLKAASARDVEEARRLLYVGMTRTQDRLVLTCTSTRSGKPSRGHQFLDEMGLVPEAPR
jgi:DNA polymerase III epsilon subunit family exonuclease